MKTPITWDIDNEEHPRNAGAIRTALMLGAEFFPDGNRWRVKGIAGSFSKTMAAFMFIATHGLGIDQNGSPRKFKDMFDAAHKERLRRNSEGVRGHQSEKPDDDPRVHALLCDRRRHR